jgi:uncharacterized protein (UPF0333 family)
MEQENFSPQQSLQLIDSMINKAKNRFNENGFLYLLWGWVIFISAIVHFAALKFQLFKKPEIIWVSTIAATLYQIFYLVKAKKKETVKTYSDGIIDAVWMCFGICMGILSFIVGKNNGWEYMYPLVLMFYGIPTFLSGTVMQFMPLKLGGIACWLLAIIATFVSPLYYLLLLALAVLIAWIIPGYLMSQKFKKEKL